MSSCCTWYRGTTVDGWNLGDLGGLKKELGETGFIAVARSRLGFWT